MIKKKDNTKDKDSYVSCMLSAPGKMLFFKIAGLWTLPFIVIFFFYTAILEKMPFELLFFIIYFSVIGGIIFAGCFFWLQIIFTDKVLAKFSGYREKVLCEFITPNQLRTLNLQNKPDDLNQNLLHILHIKKARKIENYLDSDGVIKAVFGIGIWMPAKLVRIEVNVLSAKLVRININSKPKLKTQIVDLGENLRMVEELLAFLQEKYKGLEVQKK